MGTPKTFSNTILSFATGLFVGLSLWSLLDSVRSYHFADSRDVGTLASDPIASNFWTSGTNSSSGVVEEVSSNRNPHVIVLSCNKRYGPAIAASVVSLRQDGGYEKDDIAIVLTEGRHFKKEWMNEEIRRLGGSLDNILVYSTTELFDSLLLSPNNATDDSEENNYLRQAPAPASCLGFHRRRGHESYYNKMLMFHPMFAQNYEKVLFLDGCMTYHSPHVADELLQMPEISNSILAAPDPWVFGYKMLGGRILECANASQRERVQELVGSQHDLRQNATYFTTGLVLFDTRLVRDYGEDDRSTLLELLRLYHELGSVFEGDQLIVSVYWMYMRQQYRILPLRLLGSPRVPYEFLPSLPNDPHILTAGNTERPVCRDRPSVSFEQSAQLSSLAAEKKQKALKQSPSVRRSHENNV